MQSEGLYARGGHKMNNNFSDYGPKPRGLPNIKTKNLNVDQVNVIHNHVREDSGYDFIDFIESQFGAILYSMVLFLLFFMLIFSTVMRFLIEKETHLIFFKKMQFISGILCFLALSVPFLLPYLHLAYKEMMLDNQRHNRGTRLGIVFNLTTRRARRTLKTLMVQVENKYRQMRGMTPREVPSRYKLVV